MGCYSDKNCGKQGDSGLNSKPKPERVGQLLQQQAPQPQLESLL